MKKKFVSKSAFFNPRVLLGAVLCFAGVVFALFVFRTASAQPRTPSGQSGDSQPIVQAQYRGVLQVVKFDISPPLRDMKPLPWTECTKSEDEEGGPIPLGPVGPVVPDPVVQRLVGSVGIQIPNPIVSFDGNSNLCGCSPPDPNGEVGPNHVVTMSNLHFQIFNKSGTSLFGPAANNTLWSGFGGSCQTQNAGDPIVIYDQLADRWMLTQFTAGSPPFFECVALSQTSDPTGAYYRWAIVTGPSGNNFPDYPKGGMWPDAYYFSTREFQGGPSGPFQGVGAYALDRAQALAGNPNPTIVGFLAPPSPAYVVGDGLLPSDLDGMTPPPAGSPNYFVGSEDNNGPYGAPADALTLWKFHYDPMTPVNSTFALVNTIPVAAFNSILGLCGGTRACIPQPSTANKLDHLGYRQRPLHRLAYRNFGDHESLVTNQSVSGGTGPNGEVSGIRWWELRSPNASPVIFQQGTYAPGVTDGIHRWMGSIAMDGEGNMALGYSSSNSASPAVFPRLNYTGRLAGSALGTMPLGEGTIVAGTGSQTGSNRWGDYTALSVDPTDDLTFWYVNEYVPTTSSIGWRLRVGSFKVSQSAACNTYRVLIAYAETGAGPTTLRSQILAEPGVAAVDLFDASATSGVTPTLAQLSSYDVVVAFPNSAFADATAMGNVLADYADTGGLVVGFNFNWHVAPFNLAGRWMTGGYTPFNADSPTLFTNSTLGTFTATHPLMQEVTALNGHFRHSVTLAPGATEVAEWADAVPLIAVKTQAGHTGVGINNYPGEAPNQWSGQFGRVVVNAARWLRPATTVSGAITAGDPTQTNRLFRTDIPSECGAPNACSTIGGTFHYRAHPFVNTTGAPACITATLTTSCPLASNPIFAGAYLNSFDPANICTNNIGDGGSSPLDPGVPITFDFVVPAGATFIIVVSEVTANAGCSGYTLDIAGLCRVAPTATSIVSRKPHGGAGTFDINLPLTGPIGIEDRTGAVAGSHMMVATFASPVTMGGAVVSTGTGAVGSSSVLGNVVTVNLTGVSDVQRLGVTLLNVSDGVTTGNVIVPMGILSGDTGGNGNVNASDVGQTKGQSGVTVGAGNFREDVNSNGSINAGDVGLVKSKSGNVLPP